MEKLPHLWTGKIVCTFFKLFLNRPPKPFFCLCPHRFFFYSSLSCILVVWNIQSQYSLTIKTNMLLVLEIFYFALILALSAWHLAHVALSCDRKCSSNFFVYFNERVAKTSKFCWVGFTPYNKNMGSTLPWFILSFIKIMDLGCIRKLK